MNFLNMIGMVTGASVLIFLIFLLWKYKEPDDPCS